MLIEVSDLYDAFYELANLLWTRFEFRGRVDNTSGELGLRFDELIDQLEVDLFFAACAGRLAKETGIYLSPEKIDGMLRLADVEGKLFEGAASKYHSNAFD